MDATAWTDVTGEQEGYESSSDNPVKETLKSSYTRPRSEGRCDRRARTPNVVRRCLQEQKGYQKNPGNRSKALKGSPEPCYRQRLSKGGCNSQAQHSKRSPKADLGHKRTAEALTKSRNTTKHTLRSASTDSRNLVTRNAFPGLDVTAEPDTQNEPQNLPKVIK